MSSLESQVIKIFRHARQGSIETRREYRKCMLRFARWLVVTFHMQNLRNLSNKHVAAYVKHLLAEGCTAAYIKKVLAAIRYVHAQLPNPRYIITSDNAKLGIPARIPPGNRAWEDDEFELLCRIARMTGKDWIVDVLTLEKVLGLRIHEVMRLDTAAVERALQNGCLHVKGKGGKERKTISLTEASKEALLNAKARVKRGAKLFVPEGRTTHKVINEVQRFIKANRPAREGEQLTSHGLRYNYAQSRMSELVIKGMPQEKAEAKVARELGHNRRRVTKGYLK